jgi:hypothetical protein
MNFSMNNRFVVEPYMSDRQIKTTGGQGFAMIQQKVKLVGLKLLMSVRTDQVHQIAVDGFQSSGPIMIPSGATVWIKEELLYTQEWAKKIYECEAVEGKFIIVDKAFVEFISSDVPDLEHVCKNS